MLISRKKTDMIRRWILITLVGLILVVCVAAFLGMAWIRSQQGHSEVAHESTIESLAIRGEPADPLAVARTRGREIYEHYCQVCHGDQGKGDGPNSGLLLETLKTQPQDFTDGAFWEREETTEERVRDAVSKGGPINGKSVLMPAWGRTLTDNQIRDVIVFIRAFPAELEARE